MRLIFKIFALPFLLVLSLLAAVLMFLYDVAGWFLSLASGILAVIAVGLFVLQHQPVGGVAFLVLAFLLSPYGLPAVAEFLIGLLDELNYSLRRFITSCQAGASGQVGPKSRTAKRRLCGAAVLYGRR